MEPEHYYWTYSTIVQSLAAMIGISAVFAVYHLQVIGDNMEKKWGVFIRLLSHVNNFSGYEFYTNEELSQEADKIINTHEIKASEIKTIIHKIEKRKTDPQEDMASLEAELRVHQTNLRNFESIKNRVNTRKNNIKNLEVYTTNFKKDTTVILLIKFCTLMTALYFLLIKEYRVSFLYITTGFTILGILLLLILCIKSLLPPNRHKEL